MAASNPSATTASQSPTPDIQQLVGLLGNLMPLLLRLQSQVFPQQVFPQQAFQEAFASQAFPSQAFEPSFQSGFGNFAIPNPALDRQAAENCRRSEEHTSELQSPYDLVCRLLLEKKKTLASNATTSHARSNRHTTDLHS